MSQQSIKEIHRAMYAPEAEKRAVKVTRCAILPRVGPKWQHLSEKCAPTQTEACSFEKMQVADFEGNPNDRWDHSYAKPIAQAHGWTHLGGGLGRETFLFKEGCVVKFARSDRVGGKIIGAKPWGAIEAARTKGGGEGLTGAEQNTYEVATFNQCADNIKELMIPIVAHSPTAPYKWLVLPRAEVATSGQRYKWDNMADDLNDLLQERGATVVDLHGGNIGRLEGNAVVVDYGFRTRCPVQKGTAQKTVAKQLDQFFGKPQDASAAQQRAEAVEPTRKPIEEWQKEEGIVQSPEEITPVPTIRQKCEKHHDCPAGMMCVSPKFVTHPRYCKKSRELTKEDVLREIARVNKRFHEIPPSYRSDVKYGVDESLKTAEKEMNKGDLVMALFNVESAENEIAAEKSKLLSIGVTTYRTPKPMPVARRFKPKPQDIKRAQIMEDMAKVVSKEGRSFDAVYLREQADKIRDFGVQAIRPYDDRMIVSLLDPEHKRQIAEIVGRGRHGLKRPRAEKGGELTQKRRVLWARAGELRRNARKLKGVGSDVDMMKQMVDEARFLEQQAWHYQTKQMKSGRAPLSDPVKMMRILHPDQRQLFEPEMKKAMSESALQELWIPKKGGMSE